MRQAINRLLMRAPTWPLYVVGFVPAIMLFWLGIADSLGADPLNRLERELGEWALRFLIASLCVTPLLRFGRINAMRFRRALGLLAFGYALLHLTVFVVLDYGFDWPAIWREIIKRPFITIGFAAFLLIVPLAITSNRASIVKLGIAHWQRLHRLVYPAAMLAAIHFIMVKKTWQTEPLVYAAIIAALLALRLVPTRRLKNGAGGED